MKDAFIASLFHKGVLGGGTYLQKKVFNQTNKHLILCILT